MILVTQKLVSMAVPTDASLIMEATHRRTTTCRINALGSLASRYLA